MKLKTGDKVMVIAGKDRGKKGKILQTFPHAERVVVEGVNILKKHVRSRRQGQKGQIIELAAPLAAAKVMFFCSRCEKAVRLGYRLGSDKKKERLCKKCRETV